jgi:Carbohydrate esterase, sialic acid-specific acetylesterase
VLERARLAQESGTIRGIIFHQGESDNGQAAWLDKVQELVTDLRADLNIGDVPFVAGELLYGGCCDAHNSIINMLPSRLTNTSVVSAEGLMGMDTAHFDLAGQRELGVRYGNAMLEALK